MLDKDKRELFLFLVLVSMLSTGQGEREGLEGVLLGLIRERFFSDTEFWQPNIKFTDIHNNIDSIFRYHLHKYFRVTVK